MSFYTDLSHSVFSGRLFKCFLVSEIELGNILSREDSSVPARCASRRKTMWCSALETPSDPQWWISPSLFMVEMYFKPHNLHINQRFNLIQRWGERGRSLQWDLHNQHARHNIDASRSHIHHIKMWRINSSFKASTDAIEGRKINKDYLKERRAANGAHSEEKDLFNISFTPLHHRTTSFLVCGPDYWKKYLACELKV